MKRLWETAKTMDKLAPDVANGCRMVIAGLTGFIVAGQFVSLTGLEIPYYVTLVGAGYLKLCDERTLVDARTDHE